MNPFSACAMKFFSLLYDLLIIFQFDLLSILQVGFDCRGDVKIFDFGLAKEMRDDERVDEPTSGARDNVRPRSAMAPGSSLRASARRKGKMFTDVYEMSAPCGSYRYMAPEVMVAKPYNFSADTYSFAVLLYEISMLKRAARS